MELEEKVLKEIEELNKMLENKFLTKDVLQGIATKEELEAIREEINKVRLIHQHRDTKDAKKEIHNFITKTIGTGSTNANYTIPTPAMDEVMTLANIYGIARRLSRLIQLEKMDIRVPVEGGVTAYWTAEGSAITMTNANNVFGTGVSISLRKLAGYTEVTKEFLKATNVSIVDYLLFLFTKEITKEEDRIFLRGNTGAGDPFNGIEYTTPTTTIVLPTGSTTWNAVQIDHLISLGGAVDPSVNESTDAVYIMHPQLYYQHILQRKGTDNQYQIASYMELKDRTLLGKRIILSNQMPPNSAGRVAVIYGDFKKANIFAVGTELEMQISDQFQFQRDVIAIKLTEMVSPVNLVLRNAYSWVRLSTT
ncbi:MAG: phage major capsid protein [Brevinematia bacterium]